MNTEPSIKSLPHDQENSFEKLEHPLVTVTTHLTKAVALMQIVLYHYIELEQSTLDQAF